MQKDDEDTFPATILSDRGRKGKNKMYKLLWEGFPSSEATWEKEEDVGLPLQEAYWKKKTKR